ncbi:hypothetical protein FB451DRAFT_1130717 [Mycena latifolia]|nr:hypothetical protein FB451DRAFT_1130717 [Mycena latifolia]
MEVVTLMTMPDDMIERFNVALDQLDAIFPGEFSYEDSRRKGYNYSSFAFTWYYRMGEKGHGAPADVHPNKLHKGKGRKVNHHQRIPCCSFETVDKAMEFEALNQIFAEAFEYQRINFRHANPEAYEQVRGFADNLPLNMVSPSYPFAGYMVNFRVATDAHKDTKDGDWCLIIFVKRGEGGEICLHELGLKINGKTGGMLAFPSKYVTHFNSHFKGLRLSLVLHTDREGASWGKDMGGWGDHVSRHVPEYARR